MAKNQNKQLIQLMEHKCKALNILCPFLINIFIIDLFYIPEQTHVFNYTNDTTLYACTTYITELLLDLRV